ncbi:hypothetical protein EJB05_15154, partial [Eragrostis curvula]
MSTTLLEEEEMATAADPMVPQARGDEGAAGGLLVGGAAFPCPGSDVFALFAMPQAMGKQECYGDKEIFKHKCNNSIARDNIIFVRPSDSCCRTAQKVDMAGVCRTITPEEEQKINVHYVFLVAQDCNNPVPPGEKLDCSTTTITTPPHAAVKANSRDFAKGNK